MSFSNRWKNRGFGGFEEFEELQCYNVTGRRAIPIAIGTKRSVTELQNDH